MSATPRMRAFIICCVVLTCLFLPATVNSQQPQLSEYQVKAAFILNFVKFTEWSPECFPETNSPIVVGILGKNPFGGDMEAVFSKKTVNDRPFVIKELQSVAEAKNCHVLFISSFEKGRLSEIIKSVETNGVMTVGDMDGFTETGGIINFVRDGKKFRFQVNIEAAKKAKLSLSSKLLSVAIPFGH